MTWRSRRSGSGRTAGTGDPTAPGATPGTPALDPAALDPAAPDPAALDPAALDPVHPDTAPDDAVLLRRVADGDSRSLTRLYERHAGPLFGYLHRLSGDRMTAEEILQDTMLAVWRSAGTFAGRSKPTTW